MLITGCRPTAIFLFCGHDKSHGRSMRSVTSGEFLCVVCCRCATQRGSKNSLGVQGMSQFQPKGLLIMCTALGVTAANFAPPVINVSTACNYALHFIPIVLLLIGASRLFSGHLGGKVWVNVVIGLGPSRIPIQTRLDRTILMTMHLWFYFQWVPSPGTCGQHNAD